MTNVAPRVSLQPWLAVTVVAALSLVCLLGVGSVTLARTELLTGPLLYVLLLTLGAYGIVRRGLASAPRAVAVWARVHGFIGAVSLGLFLVHVQFRVPNGGLETMLSTLYVVVALSGVLGWWLQRRMNGRDLALGVGSDGGEAARAIHLLAEQAEQLVERSAAHTGSTTLADFYQARLADRFDRPARTRTLWFTLRARRRGLQAELVRRARDAPEHERPLLVELAALVRAVDEQDEQRAKELLFHGWLWLHGPLTVALLAVAAFHGVIARAFLLGAVP